MSFQAYMDSLYQRTLGTPADEQAYERDHACFVPSCVESTEDTVQCEGCGKPVCLAHSFAIVAGGQFRICFECERAERAENESGASVSEPGVTSEEAA